MITSENTRNNQQVKNRITLYLRKVHELWSREGRNNPRRLSLFDGVDEVIDQKQDGDEGDHAKP